jgi:hypothetical protein
MPAKRRAELAAKFTARDAAAAAKAAALAETATEQEESVAYVELAFGDCCYCGRTFQLQDDGTVKYHNEWRVKGKPYRTDVECDGSGFPPGPPVPAPKAEAAA